MRTDRQYAGLAGVGIVHHQGGSEGFPTAWAEVGEEYNPMGLGTSCRTLSMETINRIDMLHKQSELSFFQVFGIIRQFDH